MVLQGNSPKKQVKSQQIEDSSHGKDSAGENENIQEVEDNINVDNGGDSEETDSIFDHTPVAKVETMNLKDKQKKKRILFMRILKGCAVPDSMIDVSEKYLQDFILQTANKSSSNFQNVISDKGKMLQFNKDDFILETHDMNENLYIIVEGKVDVLTSDNAFTISRLTVGDVFGDVSVIFGVPCTANIRAHSDVTVIYLHKSDALSLFENSVEDEDIIDWFIKRRYFPTGATIDASRFYRRITLQALKQVPMFMDWPDNIIKTLIMKIDHTLVILYPRQSVLLIEGDPADCLFVLVEGTIEIDSDSKRVATVCISKTDIVFCFGATAVFVGNEMSCHTVRAVTNCKIIKVPRDLVFEVVEKYPDRLDVFHKKASALQTMTSSMGILYKTYKKYLQTDLLFHFLGSSDFYKKHLLDGDFLWQKLTSAVVQTLNVGSVLLQDDDAEIYETFLVIRGMVDMRMDLEKQAVVPLRTRKSSLVHRNNAEHDKKRETDNSVIGVFDDIEKIYRTDMMVKDGQLIVLPESQKSTITLTAHTWCLILKIKRKISNGNVDDNYVREIDSPHPNKSPDKIMSLEFV